MRSRPGDIFLLETVVRVHGSQKFEVHFHLEGAEPQAKEMVGAYKGL